MSYDEYYKMVIQNFDNSINSNDIQLREKILNTLIRWYQKNYEQQLIDYFKTNDEDSIVAISKEFKRVCDLNDYDKIQETYESNQLEELNRLSNQIFQLVKKINNDNSIAFNKNDYDNVIEKIKLLENDLPKIIINKFNFIKSECLLDLEYLLKNGKVQYYSIRTYDYLKRENLI